MLAMGLSPESTSALVVNLPKGLPATVTFPSAPSSKDFSLPASDENFIGMTVTRGGSGAGAEAVAPLLAGSALDVGVGSLDDDPAGPGLLAGVPAAHPM